MSLLPSEPDTEPPDAGPRVIGVDSEDAEDVLAALSSGTARELLSVLHEEPAPPSRLAEEVDTSLQNAQYHLEKLETAGAVEVVDTAYSEKGREMDVYAPADQPLVIFAGDEGESTLRSALSRLLGAVGVLAVASLAVQALVGEGGLLDAPVETGGAGGGGAGGDGGGAGTAGGGNGGDGGGVAGGDDAAAADGGGATPTPEPETTATDGGFSAQSVEETTAETTTETAVETATTAARNVTETVTETVNGTAPPDEAVRATAEGAAGLPPGLLFFAGGLVAVGVVAVALSVR